MEAQAKGATVIVCDPRLSNTGSKADHWLPTWPGTEPFLCLAIVHQMLEDDTWNKEFVERWVNWDTFLAEEFSEMANEFDSVATPSTPLNVPSTSRASPPTRFGR